MPLVANSALPTFSRLKKDGENIIEAGRATHQDIRELHIGLLNMMPDAALAATERQFFRLVGGSNQIAQFYMHPFTIKELERGPEASKHVEQYYEKFADIKQAGLDALIITGANVTQPDLAMEPFWEPLIEVIDWAHENVASVLCSCLATHAVLQFRHGQKRRKLSQKRWGVYPHLLTDRTHPLVVDVNTLFDVPHSRFNEVGRDQFEQAGLHVLVESKEAGIHLAVSEDLFRIVYFQGHPEYDLVSLLKEYKREVMRFASGSRSDYPPYPEHYFGKKVSAVLDEYRVQLLQALDQKIELPEFPEVLIAGWLQNTWHDTAEAIINNWIGKVYQVTNNDRGQLFMDGVDPRDPLGIKS